MESVLVLRKMMARNLNGWKPFLPLSPSGWRPLVTLWPMWLYTGSLRPFSSTAGYTCWSSLLSRGGASAMAVEVMTGDCVEVVSRGTWPGARSDYMRRRSMGFVDGVGAWLCFSVGAGPQWCLGVVQRSDKQKFGWREECEDEEGVEPRNGRRLS